MYSAVSGKTIENFDENRSITSFNTFRAEKETIHTSDGFLTRFIKRFYAPFLFNRWIRPIVLVGFLGLVCLSLGEVFEICDS